MQHEKLIKREDGTKVKIDVRVWLDTIKGAVYNVDLRVCPAGKRKFTYIERDDHEYRRLNIADRGKAMYQLYLNYASDEEIKQAKTELWEKLKP